MKIDRTKNTKRNITRGVLSNIISLLLPFVSRTILLKTLGSEYLGLSSLFTSVLQVLNLAELGLNSAIMYGLYKPIAEDDTETICAYMRFYRNTYRVIGAVITIIGLVLLPFVPDMIKGNVPNDVNVYWLYLLYLFNTAVSYYLFSYKTTLLVAHHRTDIQSNIAIGINLLKYSVQIIVLLFVKNYYVYIVALPVCTIANNIVTAIVTDRKYPEYRCRGKLPKEESKKVFTHIKGLVVTKMCAVLRDSADSIIISAFLGLNDVAIYSNYFYILSSVHGFMTVITSAMRGGIGNSIVTESVQKNYNDLKKFSFFYSCVTAVCSSCLLCLFQPFMSMWAGTELTYPTYTMVLFVCYFYVLCSMDIRNVYIEASGLWWQFRIRAIIETAMNLLLNIVLSIFWGVNGIMIATLITFVSINIVYGTKVLLCNAFPKENKSEYFKLIIWNAICTFVVCGAAYSVCNFIQGIGILTLMLRAAIAVITTVMLYSVLNFRLQYFRDAIDMTKRMISRSQ